MRFLIALVYVCLPAFADSDYGLPAGYKAFAAENCAGLTETNCLARFEDEKNRKSSLPTPIPKGVPAEEVEVYKAFAARNCDGLTQANCIQKYQDEKNAEMPQPRPEAQPQVPTSQPARRNGANWLKWMRAFTPPRPTPRSTTPPPSSDSNQEIRCTTQRFGTITETRCR